MAELNQEGSTHLPGTGAELLPEQVFQNGNNCIIVRSGIQATAFSAGRTPFAGGGRAETPVALQGSNIIGTNGMVIALKGINWFGFDVSPHPAGCCAYFPLLK